METFIKSSPCGRYILTSVITILALYIVISIMNNYNLDTKPLVSATHLSGAPSARSSGGERERERNFFSESWARPQKIRKRISSCHIWWVNHPLCEEIWSKPLKSENLRRIIKKNKKKVIFKLLSFAHEVKIFCLTWTAGHQKFVHFILMLYFGFIDVLRTVQDWNRLFLSIKWVESNYYLLPDYDMPVTCYILFLEVHNS